MKLYLCGPINGRSDDECRNWREQVTAAWQGETLDPMRRDYRGRELEPGIAAEIVAGDVEDIGECDAVLVYFDKPSVGTSMEVLLAHQMSKPVVVVDVSGKPPSPWLVHHSTALVPSIAAALATLSAGVQASEEALPRCRTCNDYRTVLSPGKGNETEPCPDCAGGVTEALPPNSGPFTMAQMLAFLHGEAPLDGVWFGEMHPGQKGAFWWRKFLRAAGGVGVPVPPGCTFPDCNGGSCCGNPSNATGVLDGETFSREAPKPGKATP